jgi:hypothetical protein
MFSQVRKLCGFYSGSVRGKYIDLAPHYGHWQTTAVRNN